MSFGATAAALALALVGTLMLIAIGSATANAAATCKTGSYPTGNPAVRVRIADDPTGSACLTIGTTDSSFTVDHTSNTSPAHDALRYTGFYSAYTGCDGLCYETNYEHPISSYRKILASWSLPNFGDVPGKYNGVINMIVNTNTVQPVAQQNGAEVMVWLDYHNVHLAGQELPDQRIEGAHYHVFSVLNTTPLGSWNRVAFERVDPVTDVSNVNLVPFLRAAERDGAVLPNWYLQYTTAGFQIWYGGDGLISNAFTASTPVVTVPSGSGSGSGGATSKEKDTTKPNVSISYPGCSYGWTEWTCNRFLHTLKSWTTMIGFATDNIKVSRVTVTAVRAKQGSLKKETLRARATLGRRSTWSATIKGLDYGTWTFTATASDSAGNERVSAPVTAHITVK